MRAHHKMSDVKQITVPRPTRACVCAPCPRPRRPRRWTPRTSPRRWSPGTGQTPSSWAPLCSPESPHSRPEMKSNVRFVGL